MRQSGIDVVGDIPWGTHFCQFYETRQDLIEILVPYFKAGLACNEFCMWITSLPLQVEQAIEALRASVPDLDRYLAKGQIEILDCSQWYTKFGKSSSGEMLQGWVDDLAAAQKRGHEGLRLAGSVIWLEQAVWEDFTRYEEAVNSVMDRYNILAICTYSLPKCGARETLDVVVNHQSVLVKRCGRWEIVKNAHHKKMEQALREARDSLKLKVLERTAELSEAIEDLEAANEKLQIEIEGHRQLEADLLKAKETAEAAAKAKAQFMANVSHELRTPMNSVIGMTSLLLDQDLTPEQKDFVETIRNGGDALMTLINEILDFSRTEREKTELELQPFDLRACVEEALDLVAARAGEKGLELAYSFHEDVPEAIIGDPARLRQILGNLLGNAVKFTEMGEVVLTVFASPQSGEIHFQVMDTGIGIPQDQMHKLFQPFSQLDASPSRIYEGTGLGLAISKKLVDLMDGRIWVESEIGKGSTFHVELKVCEVASGQKISRPEFPDKRVLIVEGNRTQRCILSHQVKLWGMVPVTAESASEARKSLSFGGFDIAILDLCMPDAIALAREVRKGWRSMPMILLMALGQKVPIDLGEFCLTKPLKPVQLSQAMSEIFEKRKTLVPKDSTLKKAEGDHLRILLAEDNLLNQKATLQMLKRLGYHADLASNGLEVLQALERQPYDIILMDLKMPVMDGLEATLEICRRWPSARPRIIAITAYALAGDKERCLDAGMDDYISKPVQIEELRSVLGRYNKES